VLPWVPITLLPRHRRQPPSEPTAARAVAGTGLGTEPAGVEPVDWVLLSSLLVKNLPDAQTRMD